MEESFNFSIFIRCRNNTPNGLLIGFLLIEIYSMFQLNFLLFKSMDIVIFICLIIFSLRVVKYPFHAPMKDSYTK